MTTSSVESFLKIMDYVYRPSSDFSKYEALAGIAGVTAVYCSGYQARATDLLSLVLPDGTWQDGCAQ